MANYIKDYNQCLKEIVGASKATQKEINAARKLLERFEKLVKDLGNNTQIIQYPNKTVPVTPEQIIDEILFLFNKEPTLKSKIENAVAVMKLAKKMGYKGPDANLELNSHPSLKRS